MKTTEKKLSLGLVSGRNIWKVKYANVLQVAKKAVTELGIERVWVAPSCSLIHSPILLEPEKKLPGNLKSVLSFATEKLSEVVTLAKLAAEVPSEDVVAENAALWKAFSESPELNNSQVHYQVANLKEDDFKRKSAFALRNKKQREVLHLPSFPTTTIGSLPQTAEVGMARNLFSLTNKKNCR